MDWHVKISCQGKSCCFWVISHPVRVSWDWGPEEQRPFWFSMLRVRVMKQLAELITSPCHSQPELAELEEVEAGVYEKYTCLCKDKRAGRMMCRT